MPSKPTSPDSNPDPVKQGHARSFFPGWLVKLFLWTGGLLLAGAAAILLFVAVALSVAYPNLPDISDLVDYRPKLPLRVYSADGVVIGEFGEERRSLTPIKDIPQVM
ncbi:MAG: penicillin-binding protein, partial [Bacteroidia bacterium]|nr:penicillin-binding protein [Bacteroidia bacterium]